MHCDTISELYYKQLAGKPYSLYENDLHIDVQKLRKGECLVQCFAAFMDTQAREGSPFAYINNLIDIFYEQMELNKAHIAQVLSYSDIEKNEKAGLISALLTIEEGEACEGRIENLQHFYSRGVRLMNLVWNYDNSLTTANGISNNNQLQTEKGLTAKGFEFLEEMERLGIIIDTAHISDKGFYDILENTKKPFVDSHTNARGLFVHPRNISDDMIRKMGERGCVAGVNFCFEFMKSYTSAADYGATFELSVQHIKHLVNKGGSDCVGFGSDYDGISSLNLEPANASYMPMFEAEMKRQGFSDDLIEKIYYKNVARVFKEILK